MALPRVEFHSGLNEPLNYACRLLRKACQQGARVAVTGPPPTLSALNRELWVFETDEFLPHVQVPPPDATTADANAALQLTPIWLCGTEVPAEGPTILVNLGAPAPAEPARFERIIELVTLDLDERRSARERWRDYEARGIVVEHHDRASIG